MVGGLSRVFVFPLATLWSGQQRGLKRDPTERTHDHSDWYFSCSFSNALLIIWVRVIKKHRIEEIYLIKVRGRRGGGVWLDIMHFQSLESFLDCRKRGWKFKSNKIPNRWEGGPATHGKCPRFCVSFGNPSLSIDLTIHFANFWLSCNNNKTHADSMLAHFLCWDTIIPKNFLGERVTQQSSDIWKYIFAIGTVNILTLKISKV